MSVRRLIEPNELKKLLLSVMSYNKELEERVKEEREEDETTELVDYEITENEEKICNVLNTNLPQLAPYMIYTLSAVLGKVSTFLIAPKSSGKSKIMGTFKSSNLFNNYMLVDTITAKTLRELNGDVVMAVDDFSHFIFGYDAEQLLTPLASLIQKGYFKMDDLDITSNLVMIAGMTTEAYSKVSKAPQFTSMLSDRILRTYLLYYNRKSPEEPMADDEFPIIENIKISENVEYDGMDISSLKELIANQISYDRTEAFAKKLLIGHARLCGKNKVDENDLNFCLLFEPMFTFEPLMSGVDKFSLSLQLEEGMEGFNNRIVDFVMISLKTPNLPITVISAQSKLSPLEIKRSIVLDKLGFNVEKERVSVSEKAPFIQKIKQLHKTFGGG